MKLMKEPKFKPCACKKCGTVFMPEIGDNFDCGGIYHDRYFREYKNSTNGYDISSVTHWMPLPEPPKGD